MGRLAKCGRRRKRIAIGEAVRAVRHRAKSACLCGRCVYQTSGWCSVMAKRVNVDGATCEYGRKYGIRRSK